MILNLTQHPATPEQIAAGVVESASKQAIQECLTFNDLPSVQDLHNRAETLAQYAVVSGYRSAMVGGAGYLMRPLEEALIRYQIRPLHAFSIREVVEQTLPDGSLKKTAIPRHVGFVRMEFAEVNAAGQPV